MVGPVEGARYAIQPFGFPLKTEQAKSHDLYRSGAEKFLIAKALKIRLSPGEATLLEARQRCRMKSEMILNSLHWKAKHRKA